MGPRPMLSGRRFRRAVVVSILSVSTAVLPSRWLPYGLEPIPPAQAEARPSTRPDIVLVLADDLDRNLGTLDQLPELKTLIAGQGTTFPNAFVSESLCCPSRSSIQRGQWVHNHQVVGNKPPDGGFEKFHALKEDESTVGTWLQAAGYRTGFMGKYLNGYPDTAAKSYVPPGWNEWASPAAGNPYGEFNYTLNENGSLVRHGDQPGDYLTDVISDKAVGFIQKAKSDPRPFFLFLATYAPHAPATPAPRHAGAFPGARAPRPPSYNEADVSGKPSWVQSKPLLRPAQEKEIDALFQKRLQSMLAVRELAEHVIDALRAVGRLENTYIFFTSDNGFHMGEHRLHAGKLTAYEEDIRVPLFVRGPGVPPGQVRDELVGNVDLAPTFAELAGAAVPGFVDGRSLVPLLGGAKPDGWRGAFLVEQEEVHLRPDKAARERKVLEPLDHFEEEMATEPSRTRQGIPAYNAIRTPTHTYVAYSTGERELYDLGADPYQLHNLVKTADPALLARLDAWLTALHKCRGADCRVADLAAPH